MGVFDFLKIKKNSCPADANIETASCSNAIADVIMGRKIDQPNTLLFYRKQWTGKGDSGVDWIILKYRQGNCHFLF